MKLIDEWRSSWRWLSVQFAGLSAVILTAWLALPEDIKAAVPDSVKAIAAYVGIAAAVLLRLVKQKDKS